MCGTSRAIGCTGMVTFTAEANMPSRKDSKQRDQFSMSNFRIEGAGPAIKTPATTPHPGFAQGDRDIAPEKDAAPDPFQSPYRAPLYHRP